MDGNARSTRWLKGWSSRLVGGTSVAHVGRGATLLAVQIAAAHLLGARGLGLVALCLGVIVLSGVVTGGLVGASLAALDRHDSRVREALLWWAVVLVGSSAAIGAVALRYGMGLSVTEAALFGAASVSFQTTEVMRQVFIAMRRFWQLAVVDTVALLSALGSVVILVGERRVALATFLVAVAVGQAMACLTAHALLPLPERALVVPRGRARGLVAAVGGWRAAQAAITPVVLTAARLLVVVAVGSAALGRLEAARILVVPAFLVLQGLESYLLVAYARDGDAPLASLVSRAWRPAMALGLVIVACGALLGWRRRTSGISSPGRPSPCRGSRCWGGRCMPVPWRPSCRSPASLPLGVVPGPSSRCGADAAASVAVLIAMLVVLDVPPAAVPFALARPARCSVGCSRASCCCAHAARASAEVERPTCQHSPQRSSHDSVHRAGARARPGGCGPPGPLARPPRAVTRSRPPRLEQCEAIAGAAAPRGAAALRAAAIRGGCHRSGCDPRERSGPASAQALVDDGHALATAHAHRLEAELAVARLEAVEERRGDAGAG